MLETEAKQKLCPFKLGGNNVNLDPIYCEGSGCMGWEAQTIYIRQDDTTVPITPGRFEAVEPAAGDCGMKPPAEVFLNQ